LPVRPLGLDEQIWTQGQPGDWRSLLASIDHSLSYLRSPAATAYRRYPISGITRDRVRRYASALPSRSPAELQAAVSREFEFYQATGKRRQGNVLFITAYYEPI